MCSMGDGKLAVPLPDTSKRDLPWWFHHCPRAGPEFFRFKNWENWICQHGGKISQSGPQSHWPSSQGRCVNQNAILLIYSKKSNWPGDQTNSLFQTPSLPVVKSAWEVKLSSEDKPGEPGIRAARGSWPSDWNVRCFTLHQKIYLERWEKPNSGHRSHAARQTCAPTTPSLSWTLLRPTRTTLLCYVFLLQLCLFHGLGYSPGGFLLWPCPCLHPCLPSEAEKWTTVPVWP